MDKNTILQVVNREAATIWRKLVRQWPKLGDYNVPEIKLNNRIWRTAGFCYQDQNRIELGTKFFLYSQEYCDQMINTILPHEIIHQADYNLFGESELKCGHGRGWQIIMLEYGLDANPFHTMEITR